MSVDDRITWAMDRLLKWDDYQGSPNLGANYMVASWIKLNYQYQRELINTKTKNKFKFVGLTATADFYKSKSWFKPKFLNESEKYRTQILLHEQGHFDLAQIYAQKIQEQLISKFLNKAFSYKIVSGDKEKDADQEAERITRPIYEKIKQEYLEVERKYDEVTNHGYIIKEQQIYDQKFARLRAP